MKTKFAVLVALVLSLSLAAGAWAKGFPGTIVGFGWDKTPDQYFVLTLKQNVTVQMSGKMRFYTVSGVFLFPGSPAGYPVTGNAYVYGEKGSGQLRFHLTGTFNSIFMDLQGAIFEGSADGYVIARLSTAATWGFPYTYNITLLTPDQIRALPYPAP
jgi:hypothetical protein